MSKTRETSILFEDEWGQRKLFVVFPQKKTVKEPNGKVWTKVQIKKAPSSRSDRMNAALSQIQDGKSEIECLKEELEGWKDNLDGADMGHLPKYDELDEAVENLEDVIQNLDDVIEAGECVVFPGMY